MKIWKVLYILKLIQINSYNKLNKWLNDINGYKREKNTEVQCYLYEQEHILNNCILCLKTATKWNVL